MKCFYLKHTVKVNYVGVFSRIDECMYEEKCLYNLTQEFIFMVKKTCKFFAIYDVKLIDALQNVTDTA